MTCLCDPCRRYYPDSGKPVEPCCNSCWHLDDEYPCPELCRQFREIDPLPQEDKP